MNLGRLSEKQRVKLNELIQKFLSQSRTNPKIAKNLFENLRLKTTQTYNDVSIPGDPFYQDLLVHASRITSLFTIKEDYQTDETTFYKDFYLEIVKLKKGFNISLQEFIKHLSILRTAFYERFISEIKS